MYPVETINYILGLGTLAMQVVCVGFLAVYFLQKKFPDLADIGSLIERWGMWKAFALTVGGSALTLFYSEILGFAPCGLCWLQRVFLYPQVVLLGLALYKKDKNIVDYSIALSVAGGIVALYQHYLQMGGELFRTNCSSCHNFAGAGGALTYGKYAPKLKPATPAVLYAAMQSGPESMPRFSANQLTDQQKRAITNYVYDTTHTAQPGGAALGKYGPVPEGLVIWLVGIGALVVLTLWIGARA